ncbi:MAG: ATP-binding protein [Planctomycetota bacterium]
MKRSSILWNVYIGFSVLLVVLAGLIGLIVRSQIREDTLSDIRQSLRVRAILIEAIAFPSDERLSLSVTALQTTMERMGKSLDMRVTVIARDGVVRADSDKAPSLMDNHSGRPEILKAASHGDGESERLSDTVEKQMLYYARTAIRDGKPVGFVRTALPLDAVQARLNKARNALIFSVGAGLFIALIAGYFIARHISHPISLMIAAADSVADGNYKEPLDVTRTDELGVLADALRKMTSKSLERIEALDTERNMLSTILSGMIEGIVTVNATGDIAHINAAASKMLNVEPSDMMRKSFWRLTRNHELCVLIDDSIRDNRAIRRQSKMPDLLNGRYIEMQSTPFYNNRGTAEGVIVVLHDITDMQRMIQARKDFVSNASHELKTPATAIKGIVDTLLSDSSMDSEHREQFLVRLQKQVERFSALISDLLDIARLEDAVFKLERRAFDLRRAVKSAFSTITDLNEDRHQLSLTMPETVLPVNGDEKLVVQAIYNLLHNATMYTPDGGRVSVRASKIDDNAVIEIIDTGIGIAPEEHQRIFERFYRVDKARSRERGGTGLGLAIVKHVVLAHSGSVSVESKINQGSTFRVCLPICNEPIDADEDDE